MKNTPPQKYRFNRDEYQKLGEAGIIGSRVELLNGEVTMDGRPFLFTVSDFHKMGEAGIFGEDDHVELLGGELILMSPIGSRHAATVSELVRLFGRALDDRAIVSPQNPVLLDDLAEPLPDIALLKPAMHRYIERLPHARDVLLLVEVADSSLKADREDKAPRYSRSGIPELWIVNLIENVIEVYREPGATAYESQAAVRRGEDLSVLAFPDVSLAAADILP